jgi:hypothetical protein
VTMCSCAVTGLLAWGALRTGFLGIDPTFL